MHALDGASPEYNRHGEVCNLSALMDLTGTDGDGLQKKAKQLSTEKAICKSGTHAHKKPTHKKNKKKKQKSGVMRLLTLNITKTKKYGGNEDENK